MRKHILLVGFLIATATQALAQGVTVQNTNPLASIANKGSYIADSIFRIGTRDTVKPVWWNPSWSFNGAFQLGLDGNPYYYSGGKWNGFAGGGGGSGTVTSITQGYGMALTPNPITTIGLVKVDTTLVASKTFTANEYAPISTTVRLTGAQTISSKTIISSIIQSPTFSSVPTLGLLTDSFLVLRPSTGDVYLMNASRLIIDTSSLSTRIDARVKYTDTTAMLANYLNSGDIGVSVQGYNASTTILGNTTSGSGSTILLQGSPTITLPNIAAINVSGGILTLPTGASGTLMRLADTSTLSDRINSKLNISDTATMLSPYLRKGDTTAMLANYYDVRDTGRSNGNVVTGGTLAKVTDSLGALIGGGGVTAASVSEINTGTDNTKFASPLGLAGSEYLDQSGTKLSGTTAGTATTYTLTLNPAITAYTSGLSLWVKFHLANTGAATINVNGLGAKTLVKDVSTALVANDIPINQWYTLVYDGTNFLIQDIGFGGVNLSARLLGALSDETGTGVAVFGTSPTFTTSVLGSATFSAFNTVTTNLSLGGAATTMTIGGTPATAITHTYSGNATATAVTKTLNFGTGGASGSTTAITIGSATSGATNNIKLNLSPASDASWDLFTRNASGFLERIANGTTGQVLTATTGAKPTFAAGGWGLLGNTGTSFTGNYIGVNENVNVAFKAGGGASNYLKMAMNSAPNTGVLPSAGSFGGASIYIASGDNPSVSYGTVLGSLSSGDSYMQAGRVDGIAINYNLDLQPVGGNLNVGTTTTTASAIFNVQSTAKGVLLCPMTNSQKGAIASPATGLEVYCTDCTAIDGSTGVKQVYNGATWKSCW